MDGFEIVCSVEEDVFNQLTLLQLLDFRGLEVFQAIYYLNVIIPIVIILAARVVLPLTSTSRRSKPRAQKSD